MSISTTNQTVSPRQKRTRSKGEATVEVENKQDNNTKPDQAAEGKDMPVEESQGKLVVAGERPIASSDLQVAETVSIAGIRPISASNLQVVDTINVMGVRPIGANTLKVVDSINLSGIRPIASSSLVVSQSYSIMGNRPIASNDIDDSEGLMGFID